MVLVLNLPRLGSAQSLAAMSLAQLKVQRSPLGSYRQVGFILGWSFPEASWTSLWGEGRFQPRFPQEYQNEEDPVCALKDLLIHGQGGTARLGSGRAM